MCDCGQKSLCFPGPQFIKVDTACKTEPCNIRLLSRLLVCGWCPQMGAIFVIVRWGNKHTGEEKVDSPRSLQS